MMKSWTKILPFFIVEWYAKRNLSKNSVRGSDYVRPYKGTLFLFNETAFFMHPNRKKK